VARPISYPGIIAHRCGGGLAPENSLAGLAAAARIGCHGVEFDTMLSVDGVPVLMHDETVDRTTDGRGAVAALTVAELRQLDLGGEPVPLLVEALAHCAQLGLWANVELKPPAGGEAELGRVAGELLAARWNGRGVVSSFSAEALVAAWRLAPELNYALLVEALPVDWQERVRQVHAVAVHAAAARLTDAALAAVQADGLMLACYTVNRRADADRLLALGVAVFTDRPDLWQPDEM
jgi:glycerophosphoryl diester phosphodiesterase